MYRNGNDECTMCFHRFERFSAATLPFPLLLLRSPSHFSPAPQPQSNHRPWRPGQARTIIVDWPTYIHAHPLISPPSPPIIHPSISYQSLPSQGQLISSTAHVHGSCACPFTYGRILRTFMIPCPYAFVGTELTTRQPPLPHAPTISVRAAPVVHKRSTIEMVGTAHAHVPAMPSCLSNLNLLQL